MAPHNEEDDPAVYRASTHKKAANGTEQQGTNGSVTNGANGHGAKNGKGSLIPPPDDADEMEEDEEEDSTLLTVQPGFNRLLLVLRDERVMRFVKYVSAAAEGSRWDVCGEYAVGMMAEDEDENDDP